MRVGQIAGLLIFFWLLAVPQPVKSEIVYSVTDLGNLPGGATASGMGREFERAGNGLVPRQRKRISRSTRLSLRRRVS